MHSIEMTNSSNDYNSLPRRIAGANTLQQQQQQQQIQHQHQLQQQQIQFQRNTPVRRSAGIMENHIEYFVPRSISEFNLSGVGDLAVPPPRRNVYNNNGNTIATTITTTTITQPSTSASVGQTMYHTLQPKPREKMVTFEDETQLSGSVNVSK